MAVVFGTPPDSEGWIKVTQVQYKIDFHENGHRVNDSDIPEYPKGGMGVGWEQYYHPSKDEWKFKEIEIAYTDAESRLEIASAIRELVKVIKEK